MQDKTGIATTIAEESFVHVRTVKAFSTEDFEAEKYQKAQEDIYVYGVKRVYLSASFILVLQFVIWAIFTVIVIVGAYECSKDKMQIGEISAFILMAMQLMTKIGLLAATFGAVMSMIGASTKIIMIMEYNPAVNTEGGIEPFNRPEGEITAESIEFAYPSKKKVTVLKGISFDVPKNKVVALVGKSGCGKSSIIAIIERFYNLKGGSILFDDNNIITLDPKWYKKQISLVQQEPILFSGTLRENICYGLHDDEDRSDQ